VYSFVIRTIQLILEAIKTVSSMLLLLIATVCVQFCHKNNTTDFRSNKNSQFYASIADLLLYFSTSLSFLEKEILIFCSCLLVEEAHPLVDVPQICIPSPEL
jgi:oligoendopeptidase F